MQGGPRMWGAMASGISKPHFCGDDVADRDWRRHSQHLIELTLGYQHYRSVNEIHSSQKEIIN